MIASLLQHHRCAVCYCSSTRQVIDEYGEQLHLCERCPSPEEIRDRAAAIRARWSEEEHLCRLYQCTGTLVRISQQVSFEKPVSLTASRPGRAAREEQ